jgi:hypothetical protein
VNALTRRRSGNQGIIGEEDGGRDVRNRVESDVPAVRSTALTLYTQALPAVTVSLKLVKAMLWMVAKGIPAAARAISYCVLAVAPADAVQVRLMLVVVVAMAVSSPARRGRRLVGFPELEEGGEGGGCVGDQVWLSWFLVLMPWQEAQDAHFAGLEGEPIAFADDGGSDWVAEVPAHGAAARGRMRPQSRRGRPGLGLAR